MRIKLIIVITFLLISTLPATMITHGATDENPIPPAPKFIAVVPNDGGNHVFAPNTTITIKYEADRFEVDGIILIGNGSGLVKDPENPQALNFTKISSLRDISSYEIEINVTSYTHFLAYSWYNTIENGTFEVYDQIDNAPGHQLWLDVGPQYPEFSNILGATDLNSDDSEYYAPQDSNLTLVYRMPVPEELNETTITLVFSNSSDGLYNSSTSILINMTQVTFAESDYSNFEFNYTMNQRIVFFTAFNEYGWERSFETKPIYHKITTGFDFNVSFSETNLNQYTELDIITFNVTSINQTTDDTLFYRYRYFENDTAETPLLNWTSFNLATLVTNDTYVNVTQSGTGNWTQRRVDFNIRMNNTTFNVSQKVQIQVYTEYFGQIYNESSPYNIIIQDSRPTFNLLSNNDTITNQPNIFLNWESSSVRGEVTSITLTSNRTDQNTALLDLDNSTISFTNATGDILEGVHSITINVTNTFELLNTTLNVNQSRYEVQMYRIYTLIFHLDITLPTIQITNSQVSEENGKVRLEFSFEDEGIDPSGIKYVTLSWGNNLTINITSLSAANMQYRYSGTYTITITAYDVAGNNATETLEIEIIIPEVKVSKTDESPMSLFFLIIPFAMMSLILRMRKYKLNL